jgi:hypothetical protein
MLLYSSQKALINYISLINRQLNGEDELDIRVLPLMLY